MATFSPDSDANVTQLPAMDSNSICTWARARKQLLLNFQLFRRPANQMAQVLAHAKSLNHGLLVAMCAAVCLCSILLNYSGVPLICISFRYFSNLPPATERSGASSSNFKAVQICMPFIDDWICGDRQAVNLNTLICIVLPRRDRQTSRLYFLPSFRIE